ncbi:hypothetical protein [Gimesia algae]|nr:hypothetical protein [Gimesia algae]
MNELDNQQKNIAAGARFVGVVIGCVFAGIGLTVLGFMWSQPFGGFHSPPLFFRIFASFIAIPFVVIGGFTAYCALTGKGLKKMRSKSFRSAMQDSSQGSYTCPKCNAPLSDNIDVSPHGDVKCGYCNSWFNIHHV